MGIVDWRQVAQDRNGWSTPTKEVLILFGYWSDRRRKRRKSRGGGVRRRRRQQCRPLNLTLPCCPMH
jgi:hypothetical protein